MESFSERLEGLMIDMNQKLIKLIEENGVESKHYSENCLKITKDDLMFNLEGGRWLTEVKDDGRGNIELIDNSGYSYDPSALKDNENLFLVVDHLIEVYSNDKTIDGLVIKKTKKYSRSKLYGKLIIELKVNEATGEVIVCSEDKEVPYWVDVDDVAPHSADYILCDIQGAEGIEVSKY